MEFLQKSLLCVLFIVSVGLSFYTVESISCYECNSGERYNKSACATLPAVESDAFKTDCESNYTRCRKTIQTVENDVRTIRSCATAGTSKSGCSEHTGTNSIRLKYCECDKDNCNGSSGFVASILAVFVLALGIVFADAS